MTAPRSAIDGTAPRYVPHLDFPQYRHQLGQTPHPRTHPRGHSFGHADVTASELLFAGNWQSIETFLFGGELYNSTYWWEAHEQWEALWRREPDRDTNTASFLQGLIQLSAAMLQRQAGNRRGFSRLLAKGSERLERVVGRLENGCYMGVDARQIISQYHAQLEDRPGVRKPGPILLLIS